MKFVKNLNNNIAIVTDEAGEDRIVMGCGVAFGKKFGDPVDEAEIERIFTRDVRDLSGKFEALLKEIPDKYLECADRIIAHGKMLNRLLFETKMIYKEEFQVGMDAVEMINRQFCVGLPEDEAAFLALHFVNAAMETLHRGRRLTFPPGDIRIEKRRFEFEHEELDGAAQQLVVC